MCLSLLKYVLHDDLKLEFDMTSSNLRKILTPEYIMASWKSRHIVSESDSMTCMILRYIKKHNDAAVFIITRKDHSESSGLDNKHSGS